MNARAPQLSSQYGGSLIAVIVGLGIAGIVVYVLGTSILNTINAQQSFAIRSDILDLRHYADNALDCKASVIPRPAECAGGSVDGTVMRLQDRRGGVLVEKITGTDWKKYTKVGNFALRARCADCPLCANGKKLLVEATLLRSGNVPGKDPLTKKSLEWFDVYGNIPVACEVPPP